ncbi:MAG: PAS domain-containing protein [Methanomassiliicoccales archaeon]|nr:PAS domain-containing protein [Methanomassiliicoccales archaeon]
MTAETKRKRERPNDRNSDRKFPIVALGSSAGGLEELETFFLNMPPDTGMAFVIVTHLEPHHASLMAQIISKTTTMEAVQAEDNMVVHKNKIYVIPPGKDMRITDGTLRLSERSPGPDNFLPIDNFLRSLADDRKENAFAIILSGNGSDGSMGIRAIHANLGMTMVQSMETAKYDSMPRSAIDTGLVDYILPTNEMPGILTSYIHVLRARAQPSKAELVGEEDVIHKILAMVKKQTGHDFSRYKKSTISRRIERRMAVHRMDTKAQYMSYLEANVKEITILFKELVIEVTSFFRDPKAFESLKNVLRETFFRPTSEKGHLRMWVTACSTGEEVYSIGIVLRELMEETGEYLRVQIFGTDINEEAINAARAGDYSPSITNDVDKERLNKYFIKHEGGYKVRKEIREMVIFTSHNVIQDPPFLHLDIVSCRNLLIYFEPVLQRKVLETFSMALNPNGILFLGASESITGFDDRFTTVDPRARIYQRRQYLPSAPPKDIFVPFEKGAVAGRAQAGLSRVPSLNERIEKVFLDEYTPAGLVVNEKNEIVYFHGHINKYLDPASGRANLGIRSLLHENIRYIVMSLIDEVRSSGGIAIKEATRVRSNGSTTYLNIIARSLDHGPVSDILVVFDEKAVPEELLKANEQAAGPCNDARIGELERELNYAKVNLKNTIEQLETTNEELTSTNEELTSTNEELQSNNEELQSVVEESETGKEELNSLNEELLTVNTELERKNQELSQLNSDMRNLLNSVDEATIFLDNKTRIRRFTPQIERITNLLPGDLGRPIMDIAIRLRYEDFFADIAGVLDSLNTKEKEVQTKDGHWYKLRIMPYRTVENVIDGVVITFTDINEQKIVQERLLSLTEEAQASQEYAESIVNTVKEPLLILDQNLIVRSANASFLEQFEASSEDIQGEQIGGILNGAWNIPSLIDRLKGLSGEETAMEDFPAEAAIPTLGKTRFEITARKLLIPSGRSGSILISFHRP